DFPGLPADVNAQQFVVEVPSQGPFVVSDVNVPIAFTGLDPAIDLTGPKGGAFLRHFHNLGDTISFHGSFDDEGTRPLLFGGSGPVTPDEPLSAFDSKDPAGKWYPT